MKYEIKPATSIPKAFIFSFDDLEKAIKAANELADEYLCNVKIIEVVAEVKFVTSLTRYRD